MTHDINTVVGSGTVANLQPASPHYAFTENTFPVPNAKDSLRNRRADAVAVVNPSDFSVSIGARTTQVNIGTSATEVLASPLESRRALVIHNDGASVLYIGFDASVTTGNGFPLANGEKISFDMVGNPNMRMWLISAGTSDVRLMELA